MSMLNAKQKHRKLTFSSQRRGRCIRISMGSVSAVRTMSSEIPLFSVFVAKHDYVRPLLHDTNRDILYLHLPLSLVGCMMKPVGLGPRSNASLENWQTRQSMTDLIRQFCICEGPCFFLLSVCHDDLTGKTILGRSY